MGDFVRKQIAVPVDNLPEDDRDCCCCSTVYGQLQAEGSIEYAVKLECGHLVGSSCLTKWLNQSNSCPHCRKQLFPQTHQTHDNDSDLVETTIGEVEAGILASFEANRAPTEDEIDEMEADGISLNNNDESSEAVSARHIWVAAAKRRRSDVHAFNLYQAIRIEQIHLGLPREEALPILKPFELAGGVLGWESERALFRKLKEDGAFNLPGIELQRRPIPNMSDDEFYLYLRNINVRFIPARRGWFQHGKRITFGNVSSEPSCLEREFLRLTAQGAFRTIGVTRCFRDVATLFPGENKPTPNDYEIFLMILEDDAHYHEEERCWYNQSHVRLYGDARSISTTAAEKVWQDRRTENLSLAAGTPLETLEYVENLWLPGSRP